MSKANGAIEKKDTYLQHVSLKNYKSIKDVEIDFKPGLNIIIGKNASGKTNFINGLSIILNFDYDDFIDSESSVSSNFEGKEVKVQASIKNRIEDVFLDYEPLSHHTIKLYVNNEPIKTINNEDVRHQLFDKSLFFSALLIEYGIRYEESALFINAPFSFTLINNGNVSRELLTLTKNDSRTEFIQLFFSSMYVHIAEFHRSKSIKREIEGAAIKDEIISFAGQHLKYLNEILFEYSPIKTIRINPDLKFVKEDATQKLIIANLSLEFFVDENWWPFNLLSDGTKRLFYIISEIMSIYRNNENLIYNSNLKIILLEEPELGIHPHQLHQLMQFIKEQSKEKQIIITTHSPQVLDVLGPDELDRIIICHYDSKNRTQLNHLTEKEINKAKKYMKEEAFLSDYWRFSDLEPAS